MFEQRNQLQTDNRAVVDKMAAYLQACLENRATSWEQFWLPVQGRFS